MRLSVIVLKLRAAGTRFGNFVGGAAELDLAVKNTLHKDSAFVVPIADNCSANNYDGGINQTITEGFSIIVALANDSSDKDKTGLTAYDLLHDVRSEIFRAILGWQIQGAESVIYYMGGKFVVIDNGYLWWQFDFEYKVRVTEFDGYCDIEEQGEFADRKQRSQLDDFNYVSSEFILWPSSNLPWSGDIPINDTSITDMKTWIDFTDDPDAGPYDRGFGSAFDFYRILNRKNDPK